MHPRPAGAWPGDGALVSGIHHDDRGVTPGGVFVCVRGRHTDGHRLAARALERGALLVIGEEDFLPGVSAYLRVDDSRAALALLASAWHGHPSRDLTVVGVTGTNGKSSVTWMVQSIGAAAGQASAVLGTLGVGAPGNLRPQPHTTPEAPEFQAALARLRAEGTRIAAVEVSSHGLAQKRTYGTRFHTVVFTNLTQDHLDFHDSMGEYARAKSLLFRREDRGPAEPIATAVVRAEDPWLGTVLAGSSDPVVRFGESAAAEIRAREIVPDPRGLRLTVEHPEGSTALATSLLGTFQAENLLAAFGVGLSLGFDAATIARGLSAVPGIPGRMERVERGQPFLAVVDYAHTPDALQRAAESLRPFVDGRLLLVFGCGGDRDMAKRAEMGRIASEVADVVVITDDNPRSEDPAVIRAAILAGVSSSGGSAVDAPGRARAIQTAVESAAPGDAILLAGKGHETTQTFADRTVSFDDREVLAHALEARGRRSGGWRMRGTEA